MPALRRNAVPAGLDERGRMKTKPVELHWTCGWCEAPGIALHPQENVIRLNLVPMPEGWLAGPVGMTCSPGCKEQMTCAYDTACQQATLMRDTAYEEMRRDALRVT